MELYEKDYWNDENEQRLWTAAIEENVDDLLTIWSGVSEVLLLRAARELGETTSSKHRGIGTKYKTILQPQYSMRSKIGRYGDYEPPGVTHDFCTRQLTKQMRRFAKYLILVQSPRITNRDETDKTWRMILRCEAYPGYRSAKDYFAWTFRATPDFGWDAPITDMGILKYLMNATEQIIADKTRRGAKEKFDRFRERLYGDKTGAQRRVLRGLPHPPLAGIQDLSGTWHLVFEEMDEVAVALFSGFFDRNEGQDC